MIKRECRERRDVFNFGDTFFARKSIFYDDPPVRHYLLFDCNDYCPRLEILIKSIRNQCYAIIKIKNKKKMISGLYLIETLFHIMCLFDLLKIIIKIDIFLYRREERLNQTSC